MPIKIQAVLISYSFMITVSLLADFLYPLQVAGSYLLVVLAGTVRW